MAPEPGQWSPMEEWDQCGQPDAILEADDERLTLLRSMERLEPRERTILTLRYGLEGEVPLTLKEIGRRLGITREWVRKIELRAVRKLEDGWKSGRQGRARAAARRHKKSPGSSDGRPRAGGDLAGCGQGGRKAQGALQAGPAAGPTGAGISLDRAEGFRAINGFLIQIGACRNLHDSENSIELKGPSS